MAVSCMRHASGHNYRNSSFIVDVAIGQIPRSTKRISSFLNITSLVFFIGTKYNMKQDAQLSQRDRAAGCVIVFAKSRTLELGANDLRTSQAAQSRCTVVRPIQKSIGKWEIRPPVKS